MRLCRDWYRTKLFATEQRVIIFNTRSMLSLPSQLQRRVIRVSASNAKFSMCRTTKWFDVFDCVRHSGRSELIANHAAVAASVAAIATSKFRFITKTTTNNLRCQIGGAGILLRSARPPLFAAIKPHTIQTPRNDIAQRRSEHFPENFPVLSVYWYRFPSLVSTTWRSISKHAANECQMFQYWIDALCR